MQDPKQVADRRGWRCGQMPVTLLLAGSDHLHREPHETWAPAAVLPPDCRQKPRTWPLARIRSTDSFRESVGSTGTMSSSSLSWPCSSPQPRGGPSCDASRPISCRRASSSIGHLHERRRRVPSICVGHACGLRPSERQLVGDAPNNRRRSQSASGFASRATKRSSPSVERSLQESEAAEACRRGLRRVLDVAPRDHPSRPHERCVAPPGRRFRPSPESSHASESRSWTASTRHGRDSRGFVRPSCSL